MSDKTSKSLRSLSEDEMDQVTGGSWDQPVMSCGVIVSAVKAMGWDGARKLYHDKNFYG